MACCSVAASPMHTTCGCWPSGCNPSQSVGTINYGQNVWIGTKARKPYLYFDVFFSPFQVWLFLWYPGNPQKAVSLTSRPWLCTTVSSTVPPNTFFMFCLLQPSCILLPLGMPTIELFQACGHVNALCFHIWISIWHLKVSLETNVPWVFLDMRKSWWIYRSIVSIHVRKDKMGRSTCSSLNPR